ncbi:MAG: aminopeptidase, partial [Thermoplasmata archaeon]|nr:aminopeptidase [Thermoplasmata archaeon]
MDMKEGANMVVRTCLDVQEDEEVLIITDNEKHDFANEFFKAAVEADARPLLIKANVTYEGQEPPASLAHLMSVVDVIIMVTKHSMSHTRARRNANKAGARVASLPDLREEILSGGGLTADFYEIEKLMRKVFRRIRGGKKITVSTPLGTNLAMSIKGRKWVTEDIGLCHGKGGFTTLPAGEIFIAPVEHTADGTLMIDGSFLGPLEEPAKVVLKEGIATQVVGANNAIAEMNKGGREGRLVAKFGMGLNPKSKIIG